MEKNKKTKKEIINFLNENATMALSTVGKDGYPRATTLFYDVDDDLNFYFVSCVKSQKAKNIYTNNKVALVIGTEKEEINIQVVGKAREIKPKDERHQWFLKLATKIARGKEIWPPIFYTEGADHMIFKVVPSSVQYLDLTNPSIKKVKNTYFKVK